MNRDQAKSTIYVAQQANALLNQQLVKLQGEMEKQEFRKLAQSFAQVMGPLFIDILDPLYKEYPDLAPKEFGGSAVKVPDEEFIQVYKLITSLGKGRS